MWKRLAAWWDRSEDVRTLRGLDDRMLEDMGLTRAEIRPRVMGEAETGAPEPSAPCDPPDRGEGVPWAVTMKWGPAGRVSLDT